MKKTILFLFLIPFIFSGKEMRAQNYHPVVGDGLFQWNVPIVQLFGQWIDTVSLQSLDAPYYELVYKGAWFTGEATHLGKIRDNEDHSKLYYLPPTSDTEILIMDLNLNAGDTFYTITRYGQPDTLVVDTVFTKDNLKHVQFEQSVNSVLSTDEKKAFIEGVGPNWSLGTMMEENLPGFYFICKYENQELIYSISNSIVRDCDFASSIPLYDQNDPFISIFPNPSYNFITIHSLYKNTVIDYIICDIQGKVVKEGKMGKEDHTVDLTQLNNGGYFIYFTNHQKVKTVKKIIKL